MITAVDSKAEIHSDLRDAIVHIRGIRRELHRSGRTRAEDCASWLNRVEAYLGPEPDKDAITEAIRDTLAQLVKCGFGTADPETLRRSVSAFQKGPLAELLGAVRTLAKSPSAKQQLDALAVDNRVYRDAVDRMLTQLEKVFQEANAFLDTREQVDSPSVLDDSVKGLEEVLDRIADYAHTLGMTTP